MERKAPTMCFFAEEQALLNISPTSIPTLNIKEGEPPKTKNAFVAAIRPIRASTFPMMDAGRCQMDQPPEQQKEDQQQAIDTIQSTGTRAESTGPVAQGNSHPVQKDPSMASSSRFNPRCPSAVCVS